ncbi:entericidin A/B family lipoprotein [Geomonas sp. Red69]|uniref:Entericidin A/B family lipoprotein n=1 Tax=Geomonas diazotrophica TaxID=2843197 RepID=A0ABX8JH35_9BACT|nr:MULTISPECIES: entericidin A/B family lipoprotein [Geomonas]MBU5635890.1 entericidin A/B family lipoprotein [Geomonas diazotrophica]QWV96914.1 entericidin A/B family lipoprotein [Geomonas nitrogeniifigens]QXE86090.1 entericidin A/B family lipoprotein [Geomonas nitrogeniifigens]
MKRKIAAVAFLALTCIGILAGCHTVKGVGEDLQSGGREIEKSSGK